MSNVQCPMSIYIDKNVLKVVSVAGVGLSAGGLVECCQYRVDPLLLLGLIAAIGGLTFFLQQQGRKYFCHYEYLSEWCTVLSHGSRSLEILCSSRGALGGEVA